MTPVSIGVAIVVVVVATLSWALRRQIVRLVLGLTWIILVIVWWLLGVACVIGTPAGVIQLLMGSEQGLGTFLGGVLCGVLAGGGSELFHWFFCVSKSGPFLGTVFDQWWGPSPIKPLCNSVQRWLDEEDLGLA